MAYPATKSFWLLACSGAAVIAGLCAFAKADDAPAPAVPTFARDVAPIFQKHCQACHRPGEAAPMALLTYEDARPWAKAIAKNVEARVMPPWHPDPAIGEWANDRRMSEAEIKTVAGWARGGAPMGDPADLPAPLEFTPGWNIGEPDKIIYISDKDYNLAADIEDKYQNFVVNPGFKEDVWIQAVEARPGNRAVVHHLLVMTIDSKDGIMKATQSGGGWLGSMAPGRQADIFEPGKARFIRAGSWIGFEVHYHKEKGIEAADRSMVGIKFAKAPVEQALSNMRLHFEGIKIPPGAPDYRLAFEEEFQQNVHFLTIMPHMHMRAQTMRVTAVFPGGAEETLLNVPHYDFNWQTTYYLKKPKAIPAGTRIRVEASYDNSTANPSNPDPTAEVIAGQKTTDEMMVAFIDYTVDGEDIRAGKRMDTLPTKSVSGGEVPAGKQVSSRE
ncbi:hypothetical protein HY256_06555 [Candidatus Sumerlaeota bacterium]|nr:hypothetical protein [Candidatus Sumerlaeota bacterium]